MIFDFKKDSIIKILHNVYAVNYFEEYKNNLKEIESRSKIFENRKFQIAMNNLKMGLINGQHRFRDNINLL